MSLFSFSSRGGLAFFFCVSSVVTNARSAESVGASVEELTCIVKTSARLMPSHRRKWRRHALFSSVYTWKRQYSCISGRTCLLWYDWLRFLRECDCTRGVKRPITTAPSFQVSTVSWWSIHSCLAFILHSFCSRQPCKISLR